MAGKFNYVIINFSYCTGGGHTCKAATQSKPGERLRAEGGTLALGWTHGQKDGHGSASSHSFFWSDNNRLFVCQVFVLVFVLVDEQAILINRLVMLLSWIKSCCVLLNDVTETLSKPLHLSCYTEWQPLRCTWHLASCWYFGLKRVSGFGVFLIDLWRLST